MKKKTKQILKVNIWKQRYATSRVLVLYIKPEAQDGLQRLQ